MKILLPILLSLSTLMVTSTNIYAEAFRVSTQQEFDEAHNDAALNDSIIWESGIFSDIYMKISKPNLFISGTTLGGTVFTGKSRVKITNDYITLQGFQFVDGDIGTDDVINTSGSYNHFNQLNIRAYTSYKYLVIREECQYATVTYCNFENRLNLDDKNILSILVDENNPGYHKIQYCSFKNFDGTGNDLGIEPIRIGLSTQADRNSRSLVEFCYFTQCNGDGEIISSKASQNVYRYNTFENNPKAELVLRHGSEAIVYGNFFLNGKGGIRVREGQNHYIYNNYFFEINDRAIYLQNNDSDRLDNINIAFNTIFDCSEVILGGDGNFKPTNVTFANNIFANPDDKLFEDATGSETWISNISHGNLGISIPADGMTSINPQLVENSEGYFGLAEDSPAINTAMSGYALLPQFEGMDSIDVNVRLDMMRQERSASIEERDLGSNEFPHEILIKPIATEDNTGPDYNTSSINSLKKNSIFVDNLLEIAPNPVHDQAIVTLHAETRSKITVHILDLNGKVVRTIFKDYISAGERSFAGDFKDLVSGIYSLQVISSDDKSRVQKLQLTKFIKL